VHDYQGIFYKMVQHYSHTITVKLHFDLLQRRPPAPSSEHIHKSNTKRNLTDNIRYCTLNPGN